MGKVSCAIYITQKTAKKNYKSTNNPVIWTFIIICNTQQFEKY